MPGRSLWHVDLVLRNLADKRVNLPAEEYLVLAYQPMGIVGRTIVVDFVKRTVSLVPGTHDQQSPKTVPLTSAELKTIRATLKSPAVKALPPDSGKVGFDDSAFVAVFNLAGRSQSIRHWQADPELAGIKALTALYDNYIRYLQMR